mgnify:CR=1 FL=1
MVTNRILVDDECTDSSRILYPTLVPIFSPRSCATRVATEVADMRLGCVQIRLHPVIRVEQNTGLSQIIAYTSDTYYTRI